MNLNPVLQTLTTFPGWLKQRAQGMFNLNDPRWGRDEDKSPSGQGKPEAPRENLRWWQLPLVLCFRGRWVRGDSQYADLGETKGPT